MEITIIFFPVWGSNMIQQIETQFKAIEKRKNEIQGEVNLLEKQVSDREEELSNLEGQYKIREEALDILKIYAKSKEKKIESKVDDILTAGFNAIAPGENIRSKLQFDIKRGQAVAEPKFQIEINGEKKDVNIEKSDSGGFANVAGFLYKLLILSMYNPRQRPVIIADEPFKNLSECYLEATGNFIKMLATKLNIQVVLITHKTQLQEIGDKHYHFTKENGVTKVSEV
jgi:DNA repair exonuclease SbcCD ATPase subunit